MDAQLQSRAFRAARQAITAERLLGIDAIPIGDLALPDADPVSPLAAPASAPEPQAIAPPVARTPPARVAPPARPAIAPPAEQPALPGVGVTASQFGMPGTLPEPAKPVNRIPREKKIELLRAMDEQEVRGCRKCVLCESRTNTVFGEGDPETPVMFVGEGPGETEDMTGRPFVGNAGELLAKMIVAMGLSRERVYIANVVKCRPPGNRVPAPAEVLACQGYLFRQIQTIQPRVIVTLGGPATKLLLNTERGITSIRGVWHTITTPVMDDPTLVHPIPVMPTFHPAYVLRAYTPENRKKVWSDLQQVMSLLKTVQ